MKRVLELCLPALLSTALSVGLSCGWTTGAAPSPRRPSPRP